MGRARNSMRLQHLRWNCLSRFCVFGCWVLVFCDIGKPKRILAKATRWRFQYEYAQVRSMELHCGLVRWFRRTFASLCNVGASRLCEDYSLIGDFVFMLQQANMA